MKFNSKMVLGAALLATASVTSLGAMAAAKKPVVVGVSWSNFQEERWKTDEAAIKGVLNQAHAKYISADAQSSATKQLNDVDSLISQGATVLILLAIDANAIIPAVKKAAAAGIPVIAYDREIEDPSVLYLTFNNVGVGKLMAKDILAAKPKGNYVFIKGDKGDPNSSFLFSGMMQVLGPALKSGAIKNVGETFTDGWKPDNAQKEMEQILTKDNNKVDAVMSENDGMATGVSAALKAQGLLGSVALSGQDGDHAALNRVALGEQTLSVWKDSRVLGREAAKDALLLAKGVKMDKIPGTSPFSDGAKHVKVVSKLLLPVAITKKNLDVVIKAGWIKKSEVCNGVKKGTVAACN